MCRGLRHIGVWNEINLLDSGSAKVWMVVLSVVVVYCVIALIWAVVDYRNLWNLMPATVGKCWRKVQEIMGWFGRKF